MSSTLEGKVAIVTGSSAGLGETIALVFASRGASVTLCGRDQARLQLVLDKAVKINGGKKGKFIAVQGDVSDHNVRKQIVGQTVDTFGRLDILVNNAGIVGSPGSFFDETEAYFDDILNTNLKSVFFLTQLAVPHLEKSKGNIVNISSVAANMVAQNLTTYSITKAALDHLTRCLAVDLGPKGIRVNSVNPGYFPTLIFRNAPDPDETMRHSEKSQNEKQPLQGRIGISEDVAEAVSFLASDAAGFITGENFKVDGGRNFAGPFF